MSAQSRIARALFYFSVPVLSGLLLVAGCSSGGASSSSNSTQPQVVAAAAPAFSVASGTYTSSQSVTLSSSTAGAQIYYTVDGSTPTTASTLYSAALTVSASETIKAIAVASGYSTSSVASATYSIKLADTALTGRVLSGTQPISGAHVYLLAANSSGYGGAGIAASGSNASVSLLAAAQTGTSDTVGAYVLTGTDGAFSLSGDYTCSAGQQLYVYAAGGTVGTTANPGIGLMAVIGACPGTTGTPISVTVNEVTTVAAAYALSGFATDATHVSSAGTAQAKVGLANAFATAANLANASTGAALATTPAGNGAVPQAEINMLADALSRCVRDGSACSGLFAVATADGTAAGDKPAETATAAMNIAHHPIANVAALYGIASAATTYTPAMTQAPADWTVMLSFAGSPLNGPDAVAIDALGNAWVANRTDSSVGELSATGVPVRTAQVTGGCINKPAQIAIDPIGDAWVAGDSMPCVAEISPSGALLSGAGGFTGLNYFGHNSLNTVLGLAIDGNGNVFVPNAGGNTGISEFNNAGQFMGWRDTVLVSPQQAAVDATGRVWMSTWTNAGLFVVTDSTPPGANLYPSLYFGGLNAIGLGSFGLARPASIAIDNQGNAWVADYQGTPPLTQIDRNFVWVGGYGVGSCYGSPMAVAADGASHIWLTCVYGIGEFSNTGVSLSGISPFRHTETAYSTSIGIDPSGNVWRTTSDGSLTEIVGAAVPVVTPLSLGVKNNMLGTRP